MRRDYDLGFPRFMKKQAVYFVSLGCPKNRVDTEVMLGLSDRAGFTIARAPEDADVIVVNTCGFIGEAKEESIDTILEMARYKSEGGRAKRLVVTGCLSQRYSGELSRDMPEVDHFLGSGDVDKIVGALRGETPARRRDAWIRPYLVRRRHAAPAVAAGLHRVRQDRRGLRPPLLVLHHPEAARRAALALGRVGRARGARRSSRAAPSRSTWWRRT